MGSYLVAKQDVYRYGFIRIGIGLCAVGSTNIPAIPITQYIGA